MTGDWQRYARTVGELKASLAGFPDDTPVVMSKDAEGNGYSPLSGVHPAHYEAYNTWSGEIMCPEEDFNPEEYDSDTWEDHVKDAVPVVLLGPVN